MSKKLYFGIEGMSCTGCADIITKFFNDYFKTQQYQIKQYFVDDSRKILIIDIDDNQNEQAIINDIIKTDSGFTIAFVGKDCVAPVSSSIDKAADKIEENDDDGDDDAQDNIENLLLENQSRRFNLPLSIFLGISSILIGAGVLALMLSGLALPVYATYIIVFGCSLLTLTLGAGSYWSAIKNLKELKLTKDTLFSISTLTVIGVSIASLFVPWLPGMIETGLFIFGFRLIGKAIEHYFEKSTVKGPLFENRCTPVIQRRKKNGVFEPCSSRKLGKGNVIKVMPGEIIPVDGICLSEKAYATQPYCNGSPEPDYIAPQGKIHSGMTVPLNGDPIIMRVEQTVSQSYLARLRRETEKAMRKPAPMQETANKILKYFIPAVLALAIVSSILVGVFSPPAIAILCAVLILVSACPCILSSIPSVAFGTGASKADENQILFKSKEDFERANNIDAVMFDLNGTLTKGTPEVQGHVIYKKNDITEKEFFACLELIEKGCNQAIGKAIHAYALKKNLGTIKDEIINPERKPSGTMATINGKKYLIGNKKFLEEETGIQPDPDKVDNQNPALQIIYVAKDNIVVGHLEIEDPLREESKFVVKKLKDMNKKVYICTGNDEQRAQYYAKLLGVPEDHVYANATAMTEQGRISKKQRVEALQNNMRVAMVGDGGNDSPVMAESDFGIAITSPAGALETQESARAVITNNSLLSVLTIFSIAKETVSNIKQNIIFSLVYNTSFILIAGSILVGLGFMLHPAIGAGLMILQMSLVLLNQARIRKHDLDHKKEYTQWKNKQAANDSSYKNALKKLFTHKHHDKKSSQPSLSVENKKPQDEILYENLILIPTEEPKMIPISGKRLSK